MREHRLKRLFCIVTLIFLLVGLCGLVVSAAENNRIIVGIDLYFDPDEDYYIYVLSHYGKQEMTSNICTGMLTNDPVWIEVPIGVNVKLYRNGVQQTDPDLSNISQVGQYSVSYEDTYGSSFPIIEFTILGEYYGSDADFVPPNGFWITGLTKDGRSADFWNEYADLSEEGHYKMTLTGVVTGQDYPLEFTVDRTPPTLKLSEVSNGTALSSVDISDWDQKDNIYITLGGKQIEYSPKLREAGNYKIILTDQAGNETIYQFKIIVRYNFSYITFFFVAAAAAATIFAVLLYHRNTHRIR